MIAFTHITFTLLLISLIFNPSDISVYIFAVAGALLADIDYPFSIVGKLTQPLSFSINEQYGHRSVTHSLLFVMPFTIPAVLLNSVNGYAFIIGMLSHLLLDMLTNQGVKLLYPFSASFVIFDGPIITGSKSDCVLGILYLASFLLVLFIRFSNPT